MTDQGDLFVGRPDLDAIFADKEYPCPRPSDRRRKIVDRFWEFHESNDVYTELVRRSRGVKDTIGLERWSIDAAYHAVRYSRLKTTGEDAFKLNDHFTALYGRLIMYLEDDFDGFFGVRRRRRA